MPPQMPQRFGNSHQPTMCASISGPKAYEISTSVVKVDLYMVIPCATSMTKLIYAITTQIGKVVKELKNPVHHHSSVVFDDLDEQTDTDTVSEETDIRKKVDHRLDIRVGLCLYEGINQKVLTKELSEHIPGVQFFLGYIKPTSDIADSVESISSALKANLEMNWRVNSIKHLFLFPNGCGEVPTE